MHIAQKWELIKEKAAEYGLTMVIQGDIELYDADHNMLGFFHTIDEVFAFLCGYYYYYALLNENMK